MLVTRFVRIFAIGVIIASAVACGGAHDLDEEGESADALVAAPDTVIVDADANGAVSARAGVLTISFDSVAQLSVAGGERALVIEGRASRNLASVFSFVPDDAFGEVTLTGTRTFSIALRSGHEINTMLSGMPLRLAIDTKSGVTRRYEAEVFFGARLAGADAAQLVVRPELAPVWSSDADNPLRYRTTIATSRTPSSVTATGDDGAQATVIRRSARRFDADFTFGALPWSAPAAVVGIYGTTKLTATPKLGVQLTRLGLTTLSADDVWPRSCAAGVRRCIARQASAHSTDLGGCGEYRAVARCVDEAPPPDPAVSAIAARIAADVLAKTGVAFDAVVLEKRKERDHAVATVSLGRGGRAEFAVGPGSTVSLRQILDAPAFVDSSVTARFDAQLASLGLAGGRIVSHGMPSSTPSGPPASQPIWHLVVDRAGSRQTIAVRATSATTSELVPFSYDEAALRELTPALIVENAKALAANAGPYAELEVLLRSVARFSSAGGLVSETASTSPVGFDSTRETQLSAASIWGDVAFYATIVRATGTVRVAHFN